MRKIFYSVILLACLACQDDDIRVFDKTADERVAEAIANLKSDLVTPPNGWLLKYRPVEGTGSYYVLLTFSNDNKVTINTDLGAENGAYQNQTIGYRIDSSLGLELIFENYSFFSYLFELDQASFSAEYEFDYVTKTEDGGLVFSSKTDFDAAPTQIVLEPADANDINLPGQIVGTNLDIISNDLDRFSSALKITYEAKDLEFYISLDAAKRIVSFNLAARKSDPAIRQTLNQERTYYLEGNSLVLENPVTTTITGATERVTSIAFANFEESVINVCVDPFTIHRYTGSIGGNNVTVETTINDLAGATFLNESVAFAAPLQNIRRNSLPLVDEITTDIAGALQMQLYYDAQLNDGTTLNAIGFYIRNANGTITLALKEFDPVLEGNKLTFNFKDGYRLFGEQVTDANLDNMNKYFNALADGNNTYIYKFADGVFEFNNPCTGWSFVFIAE